MTSINNPQYLRHLSVHLHNPKINYVIQENCSYCKLARRKSYGNIFRIPTNQDTRLINNIDFDNLREENTVIDLTNLRNNRRISSNNISEIRTQNNNLTRITRDITSQPVRVAVPQPVRVAVPQPVRVAVPQPVRVAVPQSVRETIPQSVRETIPHSVRETIPQSVRVAVPDNIRDSRIRDSRIRESRVIESRVRESRVRTRQYPERYNYTYSNIPTEQRNSNNFENRFDEDRITIQDNIYNIRENYLNRLDDTLDINRNLLRNLNEFTRIIEELEDYNYNHNYLTEQNFDDDDDIEDDELETKTTLEEINSFSSLETYNFDFNERCAICHDDIKKNDIIRILNCNHFFHYKCVDKWLENKHQCPLCRTSILSSE